MKPENDIRQFFRKAAADTDPGMDEKVLAKVLAAHETTHSNDSVPNRSNVRSTIMRSPITKISHRRGGPRRGAHRPQPARRLSRRRRLGRGRQEGRSQSGSDLPEQRDQLGILEGKDGPDYSMNYLSGMKRRGDGYKDGQIVRSIYQDFEAGTGAAVFHSGKRYIREDFSGRAGRPDATGHDESQVPGPDDPVLRAQGTRPQDHRRGPVRRP